MGKRVIGIRLVAVGTCLVGRQNSLIEWYNQFIQAASLGGEFAVQRSISHDRREEDPAAKARWFQSLTIRERADLLCYFTDLFFEINPRVAERKNAQPVAGRVRVLRKT